MTPDGTGFADPGLLALLEALPDAALLVNAERRILAANQRFLGRFGIKGGIAGRPCHEVNHACIHACAVDGERCPIPHVRESGQPQRVVHLHATPSEDVYVEVFVRPLARHLPGAGFLFLIRTLSEVSAVPDPMRLVGRAPAFRTMLDAMSRVARTATPVLFVGEHGTGKEHAARTLHAMSARRAEAFVPVDCLHLGNPASQHDLFGLVDHDDVTRRGLAASADRGTLFLDDVGALPRARQGETLRLLEMGHYLPSGATSPVRVDVRVIGASEEPVQALAQRETVRPDLLDVIQTCLVHVPPLRERLQDLPLLADSLLTRITAGHTRYSLAPGTLALLERYEFPGNVRELGAILESAAAAAGGERVIQPEHLPYPCLTPRGEA